MKIFILALVIVASSLNAATPTPTVSPTATPRPSPTPTATPGPAYPPGQNTLW